MLRLFPAFAALIVGLWLPPARASDPQADLLPVDEAFALHAEAVDRDAVSLRWAIADGYYLYRHRTRVEVLAGGTAAGELGLPPGTRHVDEFFGEVETYRGSLAATLPITADPAASELRLRVEIQGCADLGICYPPHRREITVALPAAMAAALPAPAGLIGSGPRGSALLGGTTVTSAAGLPLPDTDAFRVEAVADGPDRVVVRFTIAPGYYLYRDKTTFAASAPPGVAVTVGDWPAAEVHADPYFGEQAVYFDEALVPLQVRRTASDATPLRLAIGFMGCQKDGVCYPPLKRTLDVALPAAAATSTAGGVTGLLAALGLALLGGLVLNLMPCVLPILSLKALGLAGSGESPAKARGHALWYTAGVVLSFAALGAGALALREAGLALGWGFQLQQPAVVGGLALLMVAIGLSLSGVFTVGGGLAGVGDSLAQRSGPAGDFFTGVLAVVVAAPCTAPFMGAALAYAFAAPPAAAIGVFAALGLGLALPFLAIGFVPALARRLPRPGAWMDTLKQLLAFPMYLTAAWLAWVLAQQRGADAIGWLLGGTVVMALGLWATERLRFRHPVARGAALAIVLAGIAVLWPIHRIDRPAAATGAAAAAAAEDGSEPWSPERLAALRAEGRAVFVNMTADWCVTCKANERTVLATDGFRDALAGADAVYLKGDWTDVDPAITAYLQAHGAVGVPFYAVYPAGGGEPRILPNLLTPGIVGQALADAAPEARR